MIVDKASKSFAICVKSGVLSEKGEFILLGWSFSGSLTSFSASVSVILAEAVESFIAKLLREVRLVAVDLRDMLCEGGKTVEEGCVDCDVKDNGKKEKSGEGKGYGRYRIRVMIMLVGKSRRKNGSGSHQRLSESQSRCGIE